MRHDVALAQSVMEADHLIDQKERTIESMCLRLLLIQQPIARALRKVSSALKMITDMERVGCLLYTSASRCACFRKTAGWMRTRRSSGACGATFPLRCWAC